MSKGKEAANNVLQNFLDSKPSIEEIQELINNLSGHLNTIDAPKAKEDYTQVIQDLTKSLGVCDIPVQAGAAEPVLEEVGAVPAVPQLVGQEVLSLEISAPVLEAPAPVAASSGNWFTSFASAIGSGLVTIATAPVTMPYGAYNYLTSSSKQDEAKVEEVQAAEVVDSQVQHGEVEVVETFAPEVKKEWGSDSVLAGDHGRVESEHNSGLVAYMTATENFPSNSPKSTGGDTAPVEVNNNSVGGENSVVPSEGGADIYHDGKKIAILTPVEDFNPVEDSAEDSEGEPGDWDDENNDDNWDYKNNNDDKNDVFTDLFGEALDLSIEL